MRPHLEHCIQLWGPQHKGMDLSEGVQRRTTKIVRGLERDFLQGHVATRTRDSSFKLEEGRFRLDVRKKFFPVRVVRHWNRLPREVVDAPSLEMFKARLDGALRNLV